MMFDQYYSALLYIDVLLFMLMPLIVTFLVRKETPFSFIINLVGILGIIIVGFILGYFKEKPIMIPGQNPLEASFGFWLMCSVYTVPLGIIVFLFEKFVHDWVLKPRRSTCKNQEVGPAQGSNKE